MEQVPICSGKSSTIRWISSGASRCPVAHAPTKPPWSLVSICGRTPWNLSKGPIQGKSQETMVPRSGSLAPTTWLGTPQLTVISAEGDDAPVPSDCPTFHLFADHVEHHLAQLQLRQGAELHRYLRPIRGTGGSKADQDRDVLNWRDERTPSGTPV